MSQTRTCIFTHPSTQKGCNTRSIFMRSLTGLNSEFCFAWTSCTSKRTHSALLSTHSWRENGRDHTFLKGISAMGNADSLVQEWNSSHHVHFLRWYSSHYECLLYIYIYIYIYGNCTRMLRVIVNKSWKQHSTKQQLYDHLPPISKTS